MLLPLSSQVSAPGTHISAGPRLSTTQQLRGMRPSISRYHSYGFCPPAGSSDELYGAAPPPYRSRPPLGSLVTRATNTDDRRGINYIGRRAKSESCVATYHSHDDNFLANLAAIKLLNGCTAELEGRFSARHPCSDNECSCTACALEDFHLEKLSKVISKHPKRAHARSFRVQTTLNSGADGYMSMESTDGVWTYRRYRSTPTTPFAFRERSPSDDLNRRLRSIDDILHRDSFPTGPSNKRLHTSEVSRKERSLAADDRVDADSPPPDYNNVEESTVKNTSRGIRGALRSLQNKDRSKRSTAKFPSLGSIEMPPHRDAPSVVQHTGQRSLLEDRSNMVMPQSLRDRISKRLQARSLSSRYGDFTFDSSPRRRRNDRYSSVYISSAESTPLFNAPAPCQAQTLVDTKSQPESWRSSIDPLATASLMLATVELDRLTNRQVSDWSSEVLGSGQSSACGGPPSSPALKSLASGERPSLRPSTTGCASERFIIPRNPLSPSNTMRFGNSFSQPTVPGSHGQRQTSSRFSDIRTTENILEASDEDVSPATCTPGQLCTSPSLDPGSQSLYSSLPSPAGVVEHSCAERSEPGIGTVSVSRLAEQTRLMQNDPLENYWAPTNPPHEETPEVQSEMFLNKCTQSQTRKSPTSHLQTGAPTPHNTRGLWCPPRKSPSPPRPQSVWNPDTPTGHCNE